MRVSRKVKKGIFSYVLIALTILVVLPCAVFFMHGKNNFGTKNDGDNSAKSKKIQKGNLKAQLANKKDTGKIRVYMSKSGEYKVMRVENYLTGVLCAEVPSNFNEEALNAQAVVSRTYSYARNSGNFRKRASKDHKKSPVCDDFAHCQAFVLRKALLKQSGAFGKKKWRIMKKAVRATRNVILTYEGKPANPLFHACSGGMTENATNVWGGVGAPYLKTVKSPGEDKVYDGFETRTAVDVSAYNAAMNGAVGMESSSECFPIEIVSRTNSGRVDKAEYRGKPLNGTEIRTALNLRSANFTVDMSKVQTEGKIYVTTIGFGHGVGMSQYGAEVMAQRGSGYKEILSHYYPGTIIEKIK